MTDQHTAHQLGAAPGLLESSSELGQAASQARVLSLSLSLSRALSLAGACALDSCHFLPPAIRLFPSVSLSPSGWRALTPALGLSFPRSRAGAVVINTSKSVF